MCPAVIYDHQSDSDSTDEETVPHRHGRRRVYSDTIILNRARFAELPFRVSGGSQTPLANGGRADEPDGPTSQSENDRPRSLVTT
ncbi:hypothetical protein O1611_g5932 [Lasiodiplodia mahajangana]|uniref:Uncharacterized protein n=1 Tax=Lasiodiplodia mahajangana TaxID=1108764 RepID=A0ACC2JK54_9PEZI|nr:hypothetical protein O1611_g5932 [Lasiodiplodia mahajangana]